jgi:hypothetical protein
VSVHAGDWSCCSVMVLVAAGVTMLMSSCASGWSECSRFAFFSSGSSGNSNCSIMTTAIISSISALERYTNDQRHV